MALDAWFNESTQTWWWAMVSVNTVHVGLLLLALSYLTPRDKHERTLRYTAIAYIIGCAWRSTFPVLWETRPHGCLFKVDEYGTIGGELLDQSMSHIAESAIAIMFAIKVGRALEAYGSPTCGAIASRSFWLICVLARTCCWYGCATDDKLYHVVEESTWALYACVLCSTIVISLLGAAVSPRGDGVARDSSARTFMLLTLPVLLAYIYFMVFVDVPMYLKEWRLDLAKGTQFPAFVDGLRDLLRCEVVTTAFEPWREAVVWQTGYFGVMPLFSVASLAYPLPTGAELKAVSKPASGHAKAA